MFLAATGKTLVLGLEAPAGQAGAQASACSPLRRPDTLECELQLISRPHADVAAAPGFNSKNPLAWGKHPIAPTGFSCLPPAMRELRFPHSQRSVLAPPPPNPCRTEIPINWVEAVAETIEVRRHPIEVATKVCGINPTGARPSCRQGSSEQLAWDAPKIFVSRPERLAI